MKKGNTKNWKLDGTEEEILFFAQRMNELLFDYTLDSFKYYALNINQLLKEARIRIEKTKNELTQDENLKDIIAEVNSKAKIDIVTKSLLKKQYQIYFPLKINDNKSELKTNLEILINKLTLSKIIGRSFDLIRENIAGKSKINLNILANQLVTALINVGFHQSYIYHTLNKHFFGGKKQINRTLDAFFRNFPNEKQVFTVTLKVSESFTELKDVCLKFKIEVLDNITPKNSNAQTRSFNSSKGADQIFVKCKEIRGFDIQSARLEAIRKLTTIAGFFTYFHHKNPPTIGRSAIIETPLKTLVIDPTTSPMAKGEDMTHQNAAKMLNAFIKTFSPSKETLTKIDRVINLHSNAITTNSNENRLLNLWISFETLFGTGKTTTVIHIIESLSHITSITYFERIFRELAKSIKKWDNDEFKAIKILTGHEEASTAMCAFICSTEYSAERSTLYGKLDEFPLLRFRICNLSQDLCRTDKILQILETHTTRIKWHIKRLYRIRNRIVHDGYKAKNLEILVENAHTYFDMFMDEFILDNMTTGSLKSISQAVAHYKTLNLSWIRNLKSNSKQLITKTNCEEHLLFKKHYS